MNRTAPAGKVPLAVMGDDRRIEQRRRLDRVPRGQVCSDEHASIVRSMVRLSDQGHRRPVILLQRRGNIAVAGAKPQEDVVQNPVDLRVAERVDALGNVANPRGAAGIKEPGDDAANIAAEGDRQTPDPQGAASAFPAAGWRLTIVVGGAAQATLPAFQRSACPAIDGLAGHNR